MPKYLMGIQVIKVYNVEVEGADEEEAIHNAYELSSTEIEECGDITNIEVDHPAIIEEIS